MYHTVHTKLIEQHTHRFLWCDMNTQKKPDIYVIQSVSFGDRPSGTIATVALRKTAENAEAEYPGTAQIIIQNSYMDDIIDSVENKRRAVKITDEIENILETEGFKIKGWIFSNDPVCQEKTAIPNETCSSPEKVLGVIWNPTKDNLCFEAKLDFSPKKGEHCQEIDRNV